MRPSSAALRGGPRRNFQVFSALDFLAEVTQHIPEKGEHLVRYCGLWEGPIRTLASARAPPPSSQRDPDEPRELQLVLDPEFL